MRPDRTAHPVPEDRHGGVWPDRKPALRRRDSDFAGVVAEQGTQTLRDHRVSGWRGQAAGAGVSGGKGRHTVGAGKPGGAHRPPRGLPGRRSQEGWEMTKTPLILLLGLAAAAGTDDLPSPAAIEAAGLRQVLSIRRVYVDRLTGGETAAQMRDVLISSLDGAKLFVLTENQERADAVLHGAAEDLVFTEVHSSSDGINAHANLGVRARGSILD